jgi:hypothetical protein
METTWNLHDQYDGYLRRVAMTRSKDVPSDEILLLGESTDICGVYSI